MGDQGIVPFLTQLTILATALIGAASGLIGMVTSLRNKRAIQAVHIELNSRLSELLEAKVGEAHAAGMTEEREGRR